MGVTDFIDSKACDKPVHEVAIYTRSYYIHLYIYNMHDWTDYEFFDVQVIRELTDGAGVDYSFECTGINDVLREAFVSTRDVLRCA